MVFQEYMRYCLSAYDNIRLGDIHRDRDVDAVQRAARAAGIDEKINGLPRGTGRCWANSLPVART